LAAKAITEAAIPDVALVKWDELNLTELPNFRD
jgi:hypothetical protein